jgi:hypothetical protein
MPSPTFSRTFFSDSAASDGNGEVKLVLLLIDHEQRPGVRAKEDGHLLHDGLEDGIKVQRRREGLGDIMEDADLFHLPATVDCGGLTHWGAKKYKFNRSREMVMVLPYPQPSKSATGIADYALRYGKTVSRITRKVNITFRLGFDRVMRRPYYPSDSGPNLQANAQLWVAK